MKGVKSNTVYFGLDIGKLGNPRHFYSEFKDAMIFDVLKVLVWTLGDDGDSNYTLVF